MKASDREDGLCLRSWQNVLQRWISCWKVQFWGRSALYQLKTLAISAGVIVAIVRGISLDARNMSVLSAWKPWSNCIRQWSMNGKKTFTLKYCIAVSSISSAVDWWAILRAILGFSITTSTESANASICPHKLRKVLPTLCSLMTFLQVFVQYTHLQ